MSEDNKTDLTPEMLEVMRARAAYWKPPDREWCIGEDHMARDVLDLVGEVERLRRRCDIRDRTAARWAEAAKRESPTAPALENARHRFVECKIRQEEAPPGSIMRRVCDAAMDLIGLLEQRDETMRARVVELALDVERLRGTASRTEEVKP